MRGTPSAVYSYVRSLQVEGSYPADVGCYVITAMRVAAGWGFVNEDDWPFNFVVDLWPPVEPTGLDAIAQKMRSHHYIRVRSLNELRIAIGHRMPVGASFLVTPEWDTTENGRISQCNELVEAEGIHAVCLLGYDDANRQVRFVNSWGTAWGDNGYGTLSYEYFEQALQEAWFVEGRLDLANEYPYNSGRDHLGWSVDTALGRLHGLEVYDPVADKRRGWALVREGCEFLEVEDVFVRPDERGRGVGSVLCTDILELAGEIEMPLRLWSPIVDDEIDPGGVDAVASRLGLSLRAAGVCWASRVAT